MQRLLILNWKENNQSGNNTYVDHTGVVRDVRTNKAIEAKVKDDEDQEDSMREFSPLLATGLF